VIGSCLRLATLLTPDVVGRKYMPLNPASFWYWLTRLDVTFFVSHPAYETFTPVVSNNKASHTTGQPTHKHPKDLRAETCANQYPFINFFFSLHNAQFTTRLQT
jgi:hypothetical protein